MSPELEILKKTIAEGIARRGFFLLMDDRFAFVLNRRPMSPSDVAQFAARHGWNAELRAGSVYFTPRLSDK